MLDERAAYASNEGVIGVIGTFNSGCAAIIIPVANQAPNGPLAMVSPANTYVCLTEGGPGTRRWRARQVLPDRDAQLRSRGGERRLPGRGHGRFAQAQGIKNVYILNGKEAYGLGVADELPQRGGAPPGSGSPASRPGT